MPTKNFVILEKIQDYNKGVLDNYINNLIEYLNELDLDEGYIKILNLSIKKIIKRLSDLSCPCNIFSGTTINIHDLLRLFANNEKFKDLVNEEVPDGLEYSDIDAFINNQFGQLMDILRNEDTCYRPYFRSKTGINEKQFKEIISVIGLKADLDTNIIPYVIQSNYLRGLRNITDFYIVSILARKALITSHKRVKDSGYLTRKLSLLLIDTTLSEYVDDCGTDEYLSVAITDETVAKRYNLRYFLNADGDLERFDTKYHKHLIGETLMFRSPIKCKSKDGKVCKTCYGDLAIVNKEIHVGIEAELELTEQLTQKLLSAKHLQQVLSDVIEWSEQFTENFVVDKGSVYIDSEKEKSGACIIFEDEDIEMDEDNKIYIDHFILKAKNGKESVITLPLTFSMSDATMDLVVNNPIRDNDNRIVLSFKNLATSEDPVFQFTLENNELSASLQSIIDLIESSDHLGIDDIDEMTNKFMELLGDGDIHLSAVHAELILRQLVRRKKDLTARPERFDVQHDELNEDYYVILKVSDGIFNSPSAAPSLSFEQIKKQVQMPSLFMKRGTSILDALYFQ